MVDIWRLGYEYKGYMPPKTTKSGSASATTSKRAAISTPSTASAAGPLSSPPTLRIPNINRGNIAGSLFISTWANNELVDVEPVLSRWHVQGCENCQTHLNMRTFVPLYGWTNEEAKKAKFKVQLHTRDHMQGEDKFKPQRGLDKGPLKLGHVRARGPVAKIV
jgi:hypothetical protein